MAGARLGSPRARGFFGVIALGLLANWICFHGVACGGSPRPAVSRRIVSVDWNLPDANRDGLAECLRLDIRLRVPSGAHVVDAGSSIAEPLSGHERHRLAGAASPQLIAADYMLNSEAIPFAFADPAGRCTLTVAFDGDSLRLARRDGKWIVSLRLLWSVGAPPDSSGEIDGEVPTPPQQASRFGRKWTQQDR
jgi:hypothetical protein